MIEPTPHRQGYGLTSPAKPPELATGRRLRILSVANDYLVCNPVDEAGEVIDVNIYVMKPWTLRRTPWDDNGPDGAGISYHYTSNTARTATRGDVTEEQLITPDYNVGDYVFAELTAEIYILSNSKRTRLMDSNRDGRAWAHLDS